MSRYHLASVMMRLFPTRTDAYAVQHGTGAYEKVLAPLTSSDMMAHLKGEVSIGVYQLDPRNSHVKWLCFDLDTNDPAALEHLCSLVETALVPSEHRTSLILEQSGRKGYHVWLFFATPQPAASVRYWVAQSGLPGHWKDVSRDQQWPLEFFPKQDFIDAGGFGNLVKLPLGVHAVSGVKSVILDRFGWANSLLDVCPLEVGVLPAPPHAGRGTGNGRSEARSSAHPGGSRTYYPCINRILYDDVPEGFRSNAMLHLALWLKGEGVHPETVEFQCLLANERSFDPPMDEREVKRIVAYALRSGHAGGSCSPDWLRDFCPGPCTHHVAMNAPSAYFVKEGDDITLEVDAVTADDDAIRVRLSHPQGSNRPTLILRKDRPSA